MFQTLGSFTQSLWASLLRHEQIQQDAIFKLQYLPKLLCSTRQTLLKVGFPSQSNSPSCAYSALDFDCDEDFSIFFSSECVSQSVRIAKYSAPDCVMTSHRRHFLIVVFLGSVACHMKRYSLISIMLCIVWCLFRVPCRGGGDDSSVHDDRAAGVVQFGRVVAPGSPQNTHRNRQRHR